MKAIIQAGGMGTRLRPVTYEIPKPLLPVHKQPIINHLIELFLKHGIREVALIISTPHREDFARWQKTWDDVIPMDKVHIVYEEKPRGTFGGVVDLRDWLGAEDFIMSHGDELKDFDLTALVEFHKKQGAVGTIATVPVPDARPYGVPMVEGDASAGWVTEFREKPENPPSNFVNSGLYVFSPKVFEYVDPAQESIMTEYHVFPELAKANKVAAMRMENGRWYDCGTLERWEKAMNEW
jgi:NDP-sugar pyrophosphorylase family protein